MARRKVVPVTVAFPRSVCVVVSKTSTVRPVWPRVPEKVSVPVSVMPSVAEGPVSGLMARLVGARKLTVCTSVPELVVKFASSVAPASVASS